MALINSALHSTQSTRPASSGLVTREAFTGFSTATPKPIPLWLAKTDLVSDVATWFVIKFALAFIVLRSGYKAASQPLLKHSVSNAPVWLKKFAKYLPGSPQMLNNMLQKRSEQMTRFTQSFLGFCDGWVMYNAGLKYQQAKAGTDSALPPHSFNDRVLDILITERVETLAIKLFDVINVDRHTATVEQWYLRKAVSLMQETGASIFAGVLVLAMALNSNQREVQLKP